MEKVPLLCLFFALSVSVACAGVETLFSSNADPPCPKLESIASGPSEREAPPNLSLRAKAFEIKNDIKERVDKPCHVAVSCAYVTALAPRDPSAGAFFRAWCAACRKPSAILLVPANKKFIVNNLIFQGSCQPGFILKVDRMIDPPQNSESRKNTNKLLQFAKLERLSLRGRGLIDGQGENLWAGQQRSVAASERLRKGRILVEPSEPKGHTGQGPHHH